MSRVIKSITKAGFIVFKVRSYLILGILSFVLFFAIYAFVLPATYTGGRVGLVSLQFLNLKLGIFAFLFSAELGIIIPSALYAFRKRTSQKPSAAAGSLIGSILPPLLCCSPLLPSFAALAGGLFPFAFRISGFLQGFIATYETQIYLLLSAILAYSLYLNSKQVVYAEKQICNKICDT